ncbi:D-alanyl-D-alanine carboxypeptidase family protein [Roseomonas populi]|uniref:D-alanyl-D-alanine carboxypeptidase n=1 Tax=Roseomonas populi TaxID=3121582 RepID=A0ABT1X1V9_9PROT|nr:D-alanyl-D-alanine carboxypeptidase family protein [Roseomonas pecuniae]MCR0981714.1 D-alanyl-D-alanine carboxypeptidase [Roseomonas pecuniae]
MAQGLAAGHGLRDGKGLPGARPKRARWLAALIPALLAAGAALTPAAAQIGSERYSSFIMDGRTGQALGGASMDEARYPASLTKMMTLYMLFEAMREGRITMNSRIYISEEANSRQPSKLGVPPGMTIPVEVAIYALTMKSANDVAVAIGEALGGNETTFAQMMTQKARQLGMTNTTFRNASGLPDWDQTTTARDMATLGRRLFIDFPERWHYFGSPSIRVGNYAFRSHNRMIGEYEGVDGVKTGFINASGFNNVVSAQRSGQRVFVAVFGGNSWIERDRHAAMLLDDGFARLGVQPSARVPEMVMARAPSVLGRAQAATVAAASVARSNIRQVSLRVARPVAEPAAARGRRVAAATVQRGTRTTAVSTRRVVEQGDGGRVLRVSTTLRRPAAAPARPVAAPARPAKEARHARR